jgi:hypothetical protein
MWEVYWHFIFKKRKFIHKIISYSYCVITSHTWTSAVTNIDSNYNVTPLDGKGKTIPVQAYRGTEDTRRLRLPGFSDNQHIKLARLSALCTSHFIPPNVDPWYSFLLQAESTPGPQCCQRIKSMRDLKNPIRNRTCTLLVSSTVHTSGWLGVFLTHGPCSDFKTSLFWPQASAVTDIWWWMV